MSARLALRPAAFKPQRRRYFYRSAPISQFNFTIPIRPVGECPAGGNAELDARVLEGIDKGRRLTVIQRRHSPL